MFSHINQNENHFNQDLSNPLDFLTEEQDNYEQNLFIKR